MTFFLFRSLVRTVQTLPVANLIFPPFSTNRRRPAYDTSNDADEKAFPKDFPHEAHSGSDVVSNETLPVSPE